MEKRFENFTVSILKLYRLVQRIKAYEMKEYDLKSVHVMCIYYLDVNREGMTAGELMRATYEDKAAISRSLALLKDRGYIVYDDGKYNTLIHLTEEGLKVAAAIQEKADRAVKAGSAKMTASERKLFYRSLGEIVENLAQYYHGLIGGEVGAKA